MIIRAPAASMKRRLLILTLIVTAPFGIRVRAVDNLVLSRFSDYLDALRTQTGIPGLAATIVSATDVSWEGTYGYQDVDRRVAVTGNTPFETDGLTQFIVASLALRCNESGWISIDDHVAKYVPSSPDASSTLRMLMTHTSAGPNGLVFAYRLDRLAPMAPAVSVCTNSSFRYGIGALLKRMGMNDTVPGADTAQLSPGIEQFDAATLQQYSSVVSQLAVPYAVDSGGKASASSYQTTTLTPSAGLISTVRDLAKFDLDLKSDVVVRAATLAIAWSAPVSLSGQPLPHGIGWFVQTYNGEQVVWQFGQSDVSSSMMMTVPSRGLTLILLANSPGLAQSFNLASGDLTASPFARLFLGLFVR